MSETAKRAKSDIRTAWFVLVFFEILGQPTRLYASHRNPLFSNADLSSAA
jgi:hypothetical protein